MKTFCFIIWMIITFLLTISLIGMALFIGRTIHYTHGKPDIHKSTWMEIGIKLLNSILEES